MSRAKHSHIHSAWRRLAISIFIQCLLSVEILSNAHARVHWIGSDRRRRRLERMIVFLLVFGTMLILEPREYLMTSILWGGGLALFLNLYALYHLVPRK